MKLLCPLLLLWLLHGIGQLPEHLEPHAFPPVVHPSHIDAVGGGPVELLALLTCPPELCPIPACELKSLIVHLKDRSLI